MFRPSASQEAYMDAQHSQLSAAPINHVNKSYQPPCGKTNKPINEEPQQTNLSKHWNNHLQELYCSSICCHPKPNRTASFPHFIYSINSQLPNQMLDDFCIYHWLFILIILSTERRGAAMYWSIKELHLCTLNCFLDLNVFPQVLQGSETPSR